MSVSLLGGIQPAIPTTFSGADGRRVRRRTIRKSVSLLTGSISRLAFAAGRTYRTKILQSWDTAAKDGAQNDWSVCTTWMILDGTYYLIDLCRGRFEYPKLKETAITLTQKYKPDWVLVEDASTGTALAQELKNVHFGAAVQLVPVARDKIGRLYVNQAKFAAGLVLFPRGAPFLPELEAEVLAFPQGRTDDQVDSISQALSYKIPAFLWDDKSLEGLRGFVDAIAMDLYWGRVTGRRW